MPVEVNKPIILDTKISEICISRKKSKMKSKMDWVNSKKEKGSTGLLKMGEQVL